jgi:phycocyanobilin:ferredoxin oxidoreductase
MSCTQQVEAIGRRLLDVISQQPFVQPMHTPDYGWENHRFHSTKFRMAHVELFQQPRFAVVHCCVFPHISDPAPIYGFDVIAGENKITGVFMDLSPTVRPGEPFTDLQVGQNRERPAWGGIFSEHWLACRPTPAEMDQIGDEAVRVLETYLTTLGSVDLISNIVARQNRYCLNQQQNEHTRRALVNIIGEEKTEEFMTQVLFPCV